jgi:hypothetical protein
MRHGSTIGIYVPTKPKPSQADLEALRVAGERMQELIAAAGTTEDEIVADFKKARRERRTRKGYRCWCSTRIFSFARCGVRVFSACCASTPDKWNSWLLTWRSRRPRDREEWQRELTLDEILASIHVNRRSSAA